MLMRGPVLNQEEIRRIHDDSIRILEEIGVKVPNEQALSILEQAGGRVDWDTQVVQISESMVAEALKKAPGEFTLGARDPQFDVRLPAERPVLNMDGCGGNTIDFTTGKRRPAVLQDLRDAAKIFDAIPSAAVLWSCIMPSDIPSAGAGIISSATSMLCSRKHIQDEIQTIRELPYIIELCKAFAGSEQAVIDRKLYSATYCTVAPLCHDADMLEGTMGLVKYKAPVLMYPMPACGSTGPASLYSDIALANAENLSSLVIFQLVSPGTPLIYGAALGVMNTRTGLFMEGTAEAALMMAAMTQIGKSYKLPVMSAGMLCDAHMPGIDAALERTLTTIPLVLNNVDVIQGIGLLESSMTLSLEQMLMDAELFGRCLRMAEGIRVCDERDYFEDIKAVGQGGHFLKQKSTKKAFRSQEFYRVKLTAGGTYDAWQEAGAKDMLALAHEEAAKILAADPLSTVDRNTEKLVNEIIEEAGAKL